MKKKRRFLVVSFGQSPRLEFLGMLRGIFIFSSFWSSFFHHFGLGLVHHFLGSPGICREFLGIPSKLHKNDEKMKKKRKFLVVFFGQSPRLEFLGMLRGIIFHHFGHHFFIILALVWSIISWEAQRFEVEFLGIPSKIHKHDEEMKKKRRFLVGLFGQSPRLEFLGMLRGIFIFSSFWSSFFSSFWPWFGPSFPRKLRDL